jgi:hypothetical protein
MPHEDCTLTQAKIKGPGCSLLKAEWILRLLVIDMVLIAAVIAVLVVLHQALWECRHCSTKARADSRIESYLPSGRGLRH